jgi:exodeoxyribonuclease-3
MRLVAWNCNMALHRKWEALLRLKPDIAVISECAGLEKLQLRGSTDWIEGEPVWIGENPNKGLAVFAFNGYSARLHEPYHPTLRYIAPVCVDGPARFNLLAVWAQNASGGVLRKRQCGPLRRALTKYREFLSAEPAIIAGDVNNNAIWDRPGWRINHMTKVAILQKMGLLSAYHELNGEPHGGETFPTHYWRDRRKDGPTYHLDYIFLPQDWLPAVQEFAVGTFEDWCGSGLSDHVPVVVEVNI